MKVLVVDDEENVRGGLATFLRLNGHEAEAAADLAAARAALERGRGSAGGAAAAGARDGAAAAGFGAALVDVYVGPENGASILDFASEMGLGLPVIMMSGHGTVGDAVAAVRKGAYDFLEKPIDTDRLLAALRNIEREAAAELKLEAFRGEWLAERAYFEPGSPLARVAAEARRVAASPLSALVCGPTGSGKELVARWIHVCSPRSRGPFVAVNCAAIPAELAESAFFGSRKGSFTGASADREGYFEAASGGTVFLDEVGEIPLQLQAKLLRAAESGLIQPVGSAREERADARIVAATNRDLRAEIGAGRFREDLYWRLAQVRLEVPALAERKSEIRGLAAFLARAVRARIGPEAPELGETALAWLEARAWPGNVRELRGFVERALWLSPPRAILGAEDLAAFDSRTDAATGAAAFGDAAGRAGSTDPSAALGPEPALPLAAAKEAFERAYVAAALERAGGSVARAAELLGMLPNNLSRKLKELGLR